MRTLKEDLLRELDEQAKMRKAMLLTPFEASQIRLGPDGQLAGPRKILAKLLRKLRKKA